MHIADILSRAYLSDGNGKQGQFSQINAIKYQPIGQTTLKKLRDATDAYITMQALKENTEWMAGKQGRCERINIVVFCSNGSESRQGALNYMIYILHIFNAN